MKVAALILTMFLAAVSAAGHCEGGNASVNERAEVRSVQVGSFDRVDLF